MKKLSSAFLSSALLLSLVFAPMAGATSDIVQPCDCPGTPPPPPPPPICYPSGYCIMP
ncbi:hypothetical protein J2S11_003670 [Bacillus horti]|uniref:Uncharacterized protein n=1 Tax=Caldalkalibacillus horti TaxID=77523 RepID=A0ABT9W3A9_9BACI|nr:hypothetical protein [Bacillus horti]